jgi:hypothetical protein
MDACPAGQPRVARRLRSVRGARVQAVERDQQAVTAGLALPYSSAAVEGAVTKIKMLKRQMYDPRQLRPAAQTRHRPPPITTITESAAEPEMWVRTRFHSPLTPGPLA